MTPDRPLSAVFNDIIGNLQHIIRSEFRLAKAEAADELGKMRASAWLLGLAMLLVSLSVVFVLLAVVYALTLVMAAWAAALVVGAGAGLVAAGCAALGIRRLKAIRAVPKTAASVKEDLTWAKQLTR